jgi:hypothetical protein
MILGASTLSTFASTFKKSKGEVSDPCLEVNVNEISLITVKRIVLGHGRRPADKNPLAHFKGSRSPFYP